MEVLTTARLRLRWFTQDDAPFMRALLNEPAWIQNIHDAEVRTDAQAADWIRDRLISRYWRLGYGFWAVEHQASGELLGLCGVIKRDGLEHPDIGYGFLSRHWGQGYAREAAQGTFQYCREVLGMRRILGTTGPENHASGRVLLAIGLEDLGVQQTQAHEGLSRVFEWSESSPASDAQQIAALRSRWQAAVSGRHPSTLSACVTSTTADRWLEGREDLSESGYRHLARRYASFADDSALRALPTPLGWRLDLPI